MSARDSMKDRRGEVELDVQMKEKVHAYFVNKGARRNNVECNIRSSRIVLTNFSGRVLGGVAGGTGAGG
jgi:hypothetical protein